MSKSLIRRVAIGAAAVAAAGALALGAGLPANAEPVGNPTFRTLPGAGSDTTQDLNNGLSQTVQFGSVKVLGSYDATGGGTIQTSATGAAYTRPNGSGEGVAALSSAIQTVSTATYRGVDLDYDDLKFARSSSRPGTVVTSGPLQYIPLAVDAVSYATINNTVIPSGIPLGTAAQDAVGTTGTPAALTLRNIYRGGGTSGATGTYIRGTVGATTYQFYVGSGTPTSGWTKLDVYVPQAGSGTRSFWATTLGFSNTTLPAGVTDTYSGGSVQEHDGSVLVGNPNAIVPFSIAQHIAQGNADDLADTYGVTVVDRREGAQLNNVGASAPLASGVLNTAFPIARPVFTVVEQAAVDSSNARYNSFLAGAFVGTTGVAYQGNTITDFGFGKLANTGTTIGGVSYIPGELNNQLRAAFTSIP